MSGLCRCGAPAIGVEACYPTTRNPGDDLATVGARTTRQVCHRTGPRFLDSRDYAEHVRRMAVADRWSAEALAGVDRMVVSRRLPTSQDDRK